MNRLVAVIGMAVVLAGCGGKGDGGGGQTLALGEEGTVGHVEYTDTGERGTTTSLGITVLAVRQGTQEELTEGGLEVDPEDRSTTPYYIDVRYENQGDVTIKRDLDVSLEDPDGNLIPSTLIFNYGGEPYEPCVKVTEGKLGPGESYESCTLVLVPEGVEVDKVSILSDMGPDAEPEFVYWDIE